MRRRRVAAVLVAFVFLWIAHASAQSPAPSSPYDSWPTLPIKIVPPDEVSRMVANLEAENARLGGQDHKIQRALAVAKVSKAIGLSADETKKAIMKQIVCACETE